MKQVNGVCGRWLHSQVYIEQGEAAAREWLRTTGFKNIDDLNKSIKRYCDILETKKISLKGLML